MAYIKNNWKNQNVERPKTYELSNNEDGTVTLIESFGNVIELGTPVNAENMNRIEKGIEMCELTKYDPNTTYNKGEWVTGEVGGIKSIYSSKIENNFGNPINDNAFWEKIKLGGTSKNIGEIVHSLLPLDDSGLHLLDGALIQGDGVYSEFVSYIANLYGTKDTHPNYFTDEDTWQASVSQYGVCGKFVYDNENNTVRLPKITGFLEGTVDLSALGELKEAGLPNITGTVAIVAGGGGASGCFTWGEYSNHINSSVVAGNNGFHFNAALSNPIYGNSNTVQPQSIKGFLYIVLGTGIKTEIEVDINNIVSDLNGKADVDLSNTANVLSNSFFEKIMPDYSAGVSIASSYTTMSAGYVTLNTSGSPTYALIKVNGFIVAKRYSNSTADTVIGAFVDKGDVVEFEVSAGSTTRTFYPLKGAN